MSSEISGGGGAEQPGDPSQASQDLPASAAAQPEPPDSFSSSTPDSWSQPTTFFASASAPELWPGQSGQQAPQPDSPAPDPWPGQPGQPAQQPPQTPQPGFAPAGADPWAQQPGQPGPFGQPATGQGPYGYQYARPVGRNNPVAICAVICGIGQFVLGLAVVGNILLAIPAIICGSIALKQIRARGERGRGMAIAGLVLGILGVVYFLLVILLVVVTGVHYRSS
jgi:hypothetical protein